MELDKRFEILPFCCFDAEKCSKYIDQKGYFANCISSFRDINSCTYGTLEKIFYDRGNSFRIKENATEYLYFIPEYFVKPKEKQYRPYTLMEFTNIFTVGLPIKFRKKGEVGNERYLILNGYSNCKLFGETTTDIYLGRGAYTLDELFNKYEWQEHYTEDFQPFGVEEEK